jgi:LuxR family maltose regulon positive regulatory protein
VRHRDLTLTGRELDVLELLGTWLTVAEIGARLGISPNTVKSHAGSAYRKLGAGSRREAVFAARRAGLIGGPPCTATPPPEGDAHA